MLNKEAYLDNKRKGQFVLRIKAEDDTRDEMLLLWKQNRGFVVKMSMKYQVYTELEDLIQEDTRDCVRSSDASRQIEVYRLSVMWIIGFDRVMQRYIDNCSGVVCLHMLGSGFINIVKLLKHIK